MERDDLGEHSFQQLRVVRGDLPLRRVGHQTADTDRDRKIDLNH